MTQDEDEGTWYAENLDSGDDPIGPFMTEEEAQDAGEAEWPELYPALLHVYEE